MKKVVLVSGGLDSFIIGELEKDATLLHINVNEAYSAKQKRVCSELYRSNSRYEYLRAMNLRKFALPNFFLPNRNVLFAVLATFYGDYIILGSTNGDAYKDSSVEGAEMMASLLSHTSYKDILVSVEYKAYTKSELVRIYLDAGNDPELLYKTTSCYSQEHECMSCAGCIRRYIAFASNGLRLEELPLHAPRIKKLLDTSGLSNSDIEEAEAKKLIYRFLG